MPLTNIVQSIFITGVLATSGCVFEFREHSRGRGTREYRAHGEVEARQFSDSNNQWRQNYRPTGPNGVSPAFRDPPYVEPRLRYDLRR